MLVSVVLFLTLSLFATYIYFAKDLQSKNTLLNRNNTGLTLLDRNNEPFFTFYEAKNKSLVSLDQIPVNLQEAVIASEDRKFYIHPGFSLRGILRSIKTNLNQQSLASGGSTITQQLVKNSLLTPDKSFTRKYQEIVLALEVERRFSKKEILEMYLNSVYLGEGVFGVSEAAKVYFDKEVTDLSLAESAMLAALIPAPSRYSPYNGNLDGLKKRQSAVLQKLVEQGYVTEEERERASQEQLAIRRSDDFINSKAVHFALLVKDQLIEKYGEETIVRSGFKVRTSLDLMMQDYSEKTVEKQVKNLRDNKVSNGAAVVIDPKTGEILTLVGSYNWYDDKFGKINMATAPRQPGSAFKPIIYLAAFEKGLITPATILSDEPTAYNIKGSPPYSPRDFDGRFRGKVLARRALANSLNVPSVEVMMKLGVEAGLEMAQRLGVATLKDPSQYGPSLVLGSGELPLIELTGAFSVFANKGVFNKPTAILNIHDKYGKEFYYYQPQPKKVVDGKYTFLISSILSDLGARAEIFGNVLNISRPAAVKTGTTENFRDSLTIGYTPSLVVGVWVGNSDNTPMDNIAGSLGAAPIWRDLMETFLKQTEVEAFHPPDGLISLSICRSNGLRAVAGVSAYQEYFVPGSEPKGFCAPPKAENTAAKPPGRTVEKPPEKPKEDNKKDNKGKKDNDNSGKN